MMLNLVIKLHKKNEILTPLQSYVYPFLISTMEKYKSFGSFRGIGSHGFDEKVKDTLYRTLLHLPLKQYPMEGRGYKCFIL